MAKMEKKCPHCRMIAKGKKDIREKFGFRILNCEEKPQSYCKECRVAHRREIDQVKKMIKRDTVTLKTN